MGRFHSLVNSIGYIQRGIVLKKVHDDSIAKKNIFWNPFYLIRSGIDIFWVTTMETVNSHDVDMTTCSAAGIDK